MAATNRQTLVTSDITNDTDHYAVQAAVALATVALVVVAAGWPGTRRLLGTSAGAVAAYLGLVSYGWPGADAGFGQAWSVAVMAWGVAAVVASWWAPTRQGTTP